MKIFWSACTFVGLFALLASCADSLNHPQGDFSDAIERGEKAQVIIVHGRCKVYRFVHPSSEVTTWSECW